MPSQADLDWLNVVSKNSQKARRESNVNKKEGGIYDLSTSYYKPKEEFPATGERNLQDDGQDFVGRDRVEDEDGGLPDGYVETDVILCVDGSPVNGQFLFKEDA
jgi:hypothetical protein